MSFRSAVFSGVPRTGLPEHFSSWGEYRRHTDILVETGIIADTSRIWWDLRPSLRYPTLETRVIQDWKPAPKEPGIRQKLVEIKEWESPALPPGIARRTVSF